ncbi:MULTISPECIES: glucosaminidase domain-containing protein [unclassified Paracoccus (in: a-proteobacteria)]|uniref:glucosaminidase domain-containing protein n=3 Tax=Paracoccus TaxID=265 RepID=UPI0004B1AC69|nr:MULTISPECIES: glucosaminidase domain-containing protein [unclassified Paracoccus (in: a-proteobacteria)]
MTLIDQSGLIGKTRDRPICKELETVLRGAGLAAGIERILITSGGQPGSGGRRTGSTRHDGGRAADLQLIAGGRTLSFSDSQPDPALRKFVIAAAAQGATGIGAGTGYMGAHTLHVGFGTTPSDPRRIVWGAGGRAVNAPQWLRDAANDGWHRPPAWAMVSDQPEDLPEDSDTLLDAAAEDDADAAAPAGDLPALPALPPRFGIEVIRAAQASQRRWGVPASVTLAQWALESDYGARMPARSNNPFGIKAVGNQPSVASWTVEFQNGTPGRRREPFRVFASLEDAFAEHGRLLAQSRHYTRARQFLNDPDRFADALTGVYATDPQYGAKLRSIMRKNDLYAFDIPGDLPAVREPAPPLRTGDDDPMRVRLLQERLTALGYKLGRIDGIFGSLTAAALLAFQHDNGLPTTGVLDAATEERLQTARPRPLDERRLTATEKQLAEDGSVITRDARRGRVLSWATAILGAFGIGNRAVVNAAGGAEGAVLPTALPATALPDGLAPFLAEIQALDSGNAAAQAARLSAEAARLNEQLRSLPAGAVPRELTDILAALRPEALGDPALTRTLGRLVEQGGAGSGLRTVLDLLPGFFQDGSVLQTAMRGVATFGDSLLPNFAGSALLLGIGLFGRHLANGIAAARVRDHRTAGNLNPLRG